MNNTIAICCPYFGKLPKNIFFTLYTMGQNEFIDWYIFTNDVIDCSYSNVKIIKMSFDEVKRIIKNKFNTKIQTVYKLCDYKPLYGEIFSRYLEKYDFWGYCDLDMIFGDMSFILNERLLEKYDKIFDLGHFSIIRNDKKVNNLLLKLNEYSMYNIFDILNSKKIYVTDESFKNHIGINEILEANNYLVYRSRKYYADIIVRYRNLYTSDEKTKYQFFLYTRGKIYLCDMNSKNKREYVYVHFQKRAFEYYIEDLNTVDNICLTPKGFVTLNDISKKCYYRYMDISIYKYINAWWKIKKNKYK